MTFYSIFDVATTFLSCQKHSCGGTGKFGVPSTEVDTIFRPVGLVVIFRIQVQHQVRSQDHGKFQRIYNINSPYRPSTSNKSPKTLHQSLEHSIKVPWRSFSWKCFTVIPITCYRFLIKLMCGYSAGGAHPDSCRLEIPFVVYHTPVSLYMVAQIRPSTPFLSWPLPTRICLVPSHAPTRIRAVCTTIWLGLLFCWRSLNSRVTVSGLAMLLPFNCRRASSSASHGRSTCRTYPRAYKPVWCGADAILPRHP